MTAHSKLNNFAPKILLCAQLALLAIRNANIVTDSMPIITPNKLYLWLPSHFLQKYRGGGKLAWYYKKMYLCNYYTPNSRILTINFCL